MSNSLNTIKLGHVLTRRKDEINVQELEIYKRLTIRMNGQGIEIRDCVPGTEIATKRQFVVKSGQLLLSKIDARNGAFGILPEHCNGAIITGNFWAFDICQDILDSRYFDYLTKTPLFIDFCIRASDGTTNRLYLQEDKFLNMKISLPPIAEQRRIVARIEELAAKINEARGLRQEAIERLDHLLSCVHEEVSKGAVWKSMEDVAPLKRRPVEVKPLDLYPELGIRSFGKGTFHKPILSGVEIGNKKIFEIHEGDLIFQIVFAWEGAVAIAKKEDHSLVGSHRFLTCVPQIGVVTAPYLLHYFLSSEGLDKLGKASPGGAGRNRTLAIKSLANIQVPVPSYDLQLRFDRLFQKINEVKVARHKSLDQMNLLLPLVLNKAFNGEL